MNSTEESAAISPPPSHYVYAMLSIAVAAICVGMALGTWGGEISPALSGLVILTGVIFVIAQHLATFRASPRGAITSMVLLPVLLLYAVLAFVGHFATPDDFTGSVIAGLVLIGVALLSFIFLAVRSNLHWYGAVEQARKTEGRVQPSSHSTLTNWELSSLAGAVGILLVSFIAFAQTVPANPVFYMKNVQPAWARFNAPKTAVYLIVQGLPDESILAEWSDDPKNLKLWLAEQAKRPGVTDFQQHQIVVPIEYPYPNSFLTWGSSATAEQGQRAAWQEGDRQYEVLWDDEFAKQFGEVPVNYIERKIP